MIRNFKSLFVVGLFMCFSSLYYFTNGNINNVSNSNLGSLENNRYVFRNYTSTSSDISSNFGYSVAFDNNGHVGYASYNGLSIGTKNDLSYKFTNYNSSTPGITNNLGYSVAFDSNGNVAYASYGGGLSIGIKNSTGYTFTNYNSSTPGIESNSARGVAFDSNGDIGYVSNGGLSIGIKSGASYTFTNYNSSTSGITNNDGYSVAFDSNGNVGYVSFGGGMNIGIKHDTTYTFTNYNFLTPGIESNFGYGIAFDSDGDIGYASDRTLSIGIKSGSSYTFTNYNSSTSGITNSNGRGVAFDSNGNVAYASYGGGLSIGIKNGLSYTFENYDTVNYSISNDNGNSVAFDSDGNVGYASSGGGLSVGTQNPTATIDTDNIVYEENINNSANYSIEDFTISFSNFLLFIVNNQNSTFIQITVSDATNNYYICYITHDGNVPTVANRASNYDSFFQKAVVASTSTYDVVAEDIVNQASGFAPGTSLNVNVKYGSSQSTLTEALPVNKRTITVPDVVPNVLPYAYISQSFTTGEDNFVYDKEKHTYNISNISLAFGDNLKALLQPTTNPVTDFIEIDVYNAPNIDSSVISTIIYIVNTTDNKDDAINDANKLDVDSNTYQEVINLNSISGDVTSFNNLNFNNLLANTNYNVAITFGAGQNGRQDMIGNESGSTLSFVTPLAPTSPPSTPSNPGDNKNTSNAGAIAGGVVGGVVGVGLIGASGFYIYKKGLSKKR